MTYRLVVRLTLLLLAIPVASIAYEASGAADSSAPKAMTAQETSDVIAEAQMRIDDSIPIVGTMKADPQVNELLAKAKGVVIVPHYLQAALVFGGKGGSGILLVRRDSRWSGPAFYKISGGTFGAQIGGSKGALVMLLMSDKAVDAFVNKASTWSLSAGAGLTAVNYSKQTPQSESLSDVVVWSDTTGLFGGAAVGASKVSRDMTANQVYYNNRDVTAQQILDGTVSNPNARLLVDALPLQSKH